MVKTAARRKQLIQQYLDVLLQTMDVEKVLLWYGYSKETPLEYRDIPMVVISSEFEGMGWGARIDKLAQVSIQIDPLVVAWGFSPSDLKGHLGEGQYIPLLGMMLNESNEIYSRPKAGWAGGAVGGNR
jgi:hypothetical protein